MNLEFRISNLVTLVTDFGGCDCDFGDFGDFDLVCVAFIAVCD